MVRPHPTAGIVKVALLGALLAGASLLVGGRHVWGEDPPPGGPTDIPPSPSTVPGVRIWPDPAFTHWPSIAYAQEERNLAFSLPVREAGVAGSIAWQGGTPLPFVLPADTDSISGLIDLPTAIGAHVAEVRIGDRTWHLQLDLADARLAWPMVALRNGFPVDAAGVAVVLSDHRRDLADERLFSLLEGGYARPHGTPWLVGDPLAALGDDAWRGLAAEAHPAMDERYPLNAVLVALAALPTAPSQLPRTIIWCPGNQALFGGAWTSEEERLLGALRTRCEHLGAMPRLVLALPPLPVDADLQAQAQERRELLQRSAVLLQWVVLDLAPVCGDPAQANQVAPGVTTRNPCGAAQERIRAALREALAR
jgi:hypothetical protein